MRNELHLSSEVASRWFFITFMASARSGNAAASPESLGEEREGAGSRQGFLALLIHSEGEGTALKQLLCWWSVPPCLVHSQKSGNTSKSDAPLRWSPPGVACEPILPTPAMMRTHRTGWTRRRLSLRLGWSQWKQFHILLTPVSGPGATKCSTCYIHPAHWSEHDRLARNLGRWGQETTHSTHSTGTISFRP